MASAVDTLVNNYQTNAPVSYYDYYNAFGKDHVSDWYESDPNSFFDRVENWFDGVGSSAKQAYQNYLSEYEYRRNALASAKANQETYAREDSQIRRLIDDYQKAGLNPYLLLNGGNLSSGVVSSQSQKPTYKKKSLDDEKVDSKVLNTAIRVLALVLLKKAL